MHGQAALLQRGFDQVLQDGRFSLAEAAHADGNRTELFRRMRELKGISGNAGPAHG